MSQGAQCSQETTGWIPPQLRIKLILKLGAMAKQLLQNYKGSSGSRSRNRNLALSRLCSERHHFHHLEVEQ